MVLANISISPVIVPPDNGNLAAINPVIVVAKLGSSPNAFASLAKVSNAAGDPPIKFEIALFTSVVTSVPDRFVAISVIT